MKKLIYFLKLKWLKDTLILTHSPRGLIRLDEFIHSLANLTWPHHRVVHSFRPSLSLIPVSYARSKDTSDKTPAF
jgi:hypothetical protein